MTACVNRKHSRRVAAVISASLVGALSLGVAPVAAMATDGDIALLATPAENFSGGKVVTALDKNNATIADLTDIEFEVDAANCGIQVTKVVLGDEVTEVTNGLKTKYATWTDVDGDGEFTAGVDTVGSPSSTFPETPGDNYVAVVSATGYSDGRIYLPFRVVNHSLQGAYIYDIASGDINDTTITYSGDAKNWHVDFGVALDGNDLASGFSLHIYDANGAEVDYASGYLINAGDYEAVLTGAGTYAGSSVKIPFTIEKFNLESASVTLDTGDATKYTGYAITPSISSVDGLSSSAVDVLEVVADGGVALDKDSYSYTLRVKDAAADAMKANFVGNGTVNLDVVGNVIAASGFKYDGATFGDSTFGSTTIDLSDEDHFVFDAEEISVDGLPEKYAGSVYVDVVDKETGEHGDESLLATPGDYYVTIRIDAEGTGYEYGGASNTADIHVTAGKITQATMYVTFQGETANSDAVTYDGTDWLDDLTILVKDARGNVVPSSEYEVVITKDGKEEVDSIVDRGVYTVTIESDSYDVSGAVYTFKVNAVDLNNYNLRVADTFQEQGFLAYTGDALEAGFEYCTSWGADGQYGDAYVTGTTATDKQREDNVWATIPADLYTVTYEQNGKEVELKEPGTYTAKIFISDPKGNFVSRDLQVTVVVRDGNVYFDVTTDHWAAEYIYTARNEKWMSGYGDSGFFGPEDNIKRGDVAVVLWKMAGQPDINTSDEDNYDEHTGYKTGFDDVDGKMYYAQAIAWAKRSGIVSGDTGTGKFRPEDSISRQELAKMLTVYAEKCNEDVTVDSDAVLGEYEDANTVSEWAESYVAYLVEAGVMGNESPLRGTDPITRAEVATMVVRLSDQFDFDFVK